MNDASITLDVAHRRIGALKASMGRRCLAGRGCAGRHGVPDRRRRQAASCNVVMVAVRRANQIRLVASHHVVLPSCLQASPCLPPAPPASPEPRKQISLGASPFSNSGAPATAHPTIILKTHGQGRQAFAEVCNVASCCPGQGWQHTGRRRWLLVSFAPAGVVGAAV